MGTSYEDLYAFLSVFRASSLNVCQNEMFPTEVLKTNETHISCLLDSFPVSLAVSEIIK